MDEERYALIRRVFAMRGEIATETLHQTVTGQTADIGWKRVALNACRLREWVQNTAAFASTIGTILSGPMSSDGGAE